MKNRNKFSLFFLVLLFNLNLLLAQKSVDEWKEGTNLHLISIGLSNMYDNYLSPLEYKGFDIKYNYILYRNTDWFNKKFVKYQNIGIDLSLANNPSGNATYNGALVNYKLGGHYLLIQKEELSIGVGGLVGLDLGVLYNNRNGNNPATGRLYLSLIPSLLVIYNIADQLPIRLQMDFDILGLYFQPNYGESYYEIYLGNRKNIFNFSSIHNIRHLKTYISTEATLCNKKIQLGLMLDRIQTNIKYTNTHNYNLNVCVGIPLYFTKK